MFTETQITEIVDLLSTLDTTTKLYFGCDSVKYMGSNGKWRARYATVLIIHKNGNSGCRLFSNISIEPDYDVKANRPRMRMMMEVQKVCELYTQMIPYIEKFSELTEDKNGNVVVKEFDIEIHLDINTDPQHGSSCAAKEAAGYVLGITNLPADKVKLKPDSFAASFGADAAAHGRFIPNGDKLKV